MSESTGEANRKRRFDYNVAMRRLMYVVAAGCALVLIYGLRYWSGGSISSFGIVCVGLMAAGASLLSGGLVGFLFGIPHTRFRDEGFPAKPTEWTSSDQEVPSNIRAPKYRPNTSLEQISDWLTKMLVGVGLVEVRNISNSAKNAAAYIAQGLPSGTHAEAFVLTALVYFSVTGFVFGFLWARLYLPRWFAEADEVEQLEEKLSQLESRQKADAIALELAIRLLNPSEESNPVLAQEVTTALKAASAPVRAQIFYQAQRASADRGDSEFPTKVEGAILIFKAFIALDVKDYNHNNHAELSYALRWMKPPDAPMAEREINEAIRIRNMLKLGGWKYYEFHRAGCVIEQDAAFDGGERSGDEVTTRVLADLRVAVTDEKWSKWCTPGYTVDRWMKLNGIDVEMLRQSSSRNQ